MPAMTDTPPERAASTARPTGNPSLPGGTLPRWRAAVWYALDGDLRFLAHQDELTMLARALVRARWPLGYSGGFNPQPRVSLALPRPVGTASACQLAIVGLDRAGTGRVDPATLAAALPAGCVVREVLPRIAPGTPLPRWAEYAVTLEPADAAHLAGAIEAALAHESLPLERTFGPGKPPRVVDVRPHLEHLEYDNGTLRMRLAYIGQRVARPAEVLRVLQLDAPELKALIRLTAVEWDQPPQPLNETGAATEGNHIGHQEDHA
jgi:radical SAM-linked protein